MAPAAPRRAGARCFGPGSPNRNTSSTRSPSTPSIALFACEAVWSPDGTWLVIRANRLNTLRDILAMRPGRDTVPRVLIASAAEEYSPIGGV